MKKTGKILTLLTLLAVCLGSHAQEKIVNPDISYAGTPRDCTIGGITVSGVEGYEDFVLIGISGLKEGQHIQLPGTEVTEAVKRYWRHGLFSTVSITADSIVGWLASLPAHLPHRPPAYLHHQLHRPEEVGA